MKTYEAGAHEAQMKILHRMLLSEDNSFGELCHATGMTTDHANFHIKQLISHGYVARKPHTHGEYLLTISGKEFANRMDTDHMVMEKQPKLSVVVIVENKKGEYLQQLRLKQPYFGYWGSLTGKIRWGETMLAAGARELMEETGLEADLRVVGFYHKLDHDEASGELLEDKYFCIVHGTNPRGELLEETDGQRNEWMSLEEFDRKEKKFGSMPETLEMLQQENYVIKEEKFHYVPGSY